MKDLIFQYQKGKMPWGGGCTYNNIFGFSISAHRSSFIWFFFSFSCTGLTLFNDYSVWLYKLFFSYRVCNTICNPGLLCFSFLCFQYLKGACISSRLLSFSRNCSKEKLTSFRLVFSKDSQSVFNRSFLKSSLLKFL